MKKILCFLLVSFLVMGQALAVTPGHRQSPGTGNIIQHGGYMFDPPKTFRLVRYVQTHLPVNLTPDTIAIWHTASNDDGVSITLSETSQDSRIAGVLVTNALTQEVASERASDDAKRQNWCYIQTYGPSEVTVGACTAVVGETLCIGNTFGAAGVFNLSTDAPGTGTDARASSALGMGGFYMDAATNRAQNVQVFLKCE